jgi:hypothetical protein
VIEVGGTAGRGAARIAVLGDRNLEYVTHRELDAALQLFPESARGAWVPTDSDVEAALAEADGVWVVPGTPYRDDDAVYAAIGAARESGLPLLGTCGGFQRSSSSPGRSPASTRTTPRPTPTRTRSSSSRSRAASSARSAP